MSNSCSLAPLVNRPVSAAPGTLRQPRKRGNMARPKSSHGRQRGGTSKLRSAPIQGVTLNPEEQHSLAQHVFEEPETNEDPESACPSIVYQLHQHLGAGAYAQVRLASHKLSREHVAIKVYPKHQKLRQQIEEEVQVLEQLQHPNIMRFYEAIEAKDKIWLVLEYCKGESLQTYISDHHYLAEEQAKNIFQQLVGAVSYLHSRNIVHHDLKPQNIIIDQKTKVIKLIDFGFSRRQQNQGTFSDAQAITATPSFCGGTPCFMAPEMLDSSKSWENKPVDIWSLGVILYYMVAGKLPFVGTGKPALYKRIAAGKIEFPAWFSPSLRNLIKQMLVVDTSRRRRADELARHRWFTSVMETSPASKQDPAQSSLFIARPELDEKIMDKLEAFGANRTKIHQELAHQLYNGRTTWYRLLHERQLKENSSSRAKVVAELPQVASKQSSNSIDASQFAVFLQNHIHKAKR